MIQLGVNIDHVATVRQARRAKEPDPVAAAVLATLGGADAKVNLARLMIKRVTLTGSTLRPRTREVKAGFARALEEKVWPLLSAGKVKVVMDSTFPLADAAAAHRRLETSQHIGKIVLTV